LGFTFESLKELGARQDPIKYATNILKTTIICKQNLSPKSPPKKPITKKSIYENNEKININKQVHTLNTFEL
jgi:hypothetical protein